MDWKMSVDLFKKGDVMKRVSQHGDQKSVYDHYLDTDRLLKETKRFVNELRDGNDTMLASKKRAELEARVSDIAVADMTFIFAEKIIYAFDQNRTNLRRQEARADNDLSQIDLLKCTAFLVYQTFYWLHRDFNTPKKETLIYFLANKGLRLPPHLDLELHSNMIALRRRAQRDPWTYISETRKRKEPLISNWIKLGDPLTDDKTGSKTKERKVPVRPVIHNESKSSENITENHLNETMAGRNPFDDIKGRKEPINATPGPGKSMKSNDNSLKNIRSLEKPLNEAKTLEDHPKSKEKRKRIIMGVKQLKQMTESGVEKDSTATNEHLSLQDPPKSKEKRKGIVMGVKHLKMMAESKVEKESNEANERVSNEAGKMDKKETKSPETVVVTNEKLPNERKTENEKKEMPLKADDGAKENPPKVETVRKNKDDREKKSLRAYDEIDEGDALEKPPKIIEKRKRIIMGVNHLKQIMESGMEEEPCATDDHLLKEEVRMDKKETKTLETDDGANENLPTVKAVRKDTKTHSLKLPNGRVAENEEKKMPLKADDESKETKAQEDPAKSKEKRKRIIMGIKHLKEVNGSRLRKEPSATNENFSQEAVRKDKEENKSPESYDMANKKLPKEKSTEYEKKTMLMKSDDEVKEKPPKVETARKDQEDKEIKSIKTDDEINALENPQKTTEKRKRILIGVKHLNVKMERRVEKAPSTTIEHVSKEPVKMDKKENKSLETDGVTNEKLPNERMTENEKKMPLTADDEANETKAQEDPPKSKEKRKRIIMGIKHLKEINGSRLRKEPSATNEHFSQEAGMEDEKETKSLDTDDVTLENPPLSKENRQSVIMGVKQLEEMMGRRMEIKSSEANGNDEQTESNERTDETSTDVKKEKLPRERHHIQMKIKLRWRNKSKNKGENIPKDKKKHPIRSAIRNFSLSVLDRLASAFSCF